MRKPLRIHRRTDSCVLVMVIQSIMTYRGWFWYSRCDPGVVPFIAPAAPFIPVMHRKDVLKITQYSYLMEAMKGGGISITQQVSGEGFEYTSFILSVVSLSKSCAIFTLKFYHRIASVHLALISISGLCENFKKSSVIYLHPGVIFSFLFFATPVSLMYYVRLGNFALLLIFFF